MPLNDLKLHHCIFGLLISFFFCDVLATNSELVDLFVLELLLSCDGIQLAMDIVQLCC